MLGILRYVFVDLKMHKVNSIRIILILLTNKNDALIYSVNFWTKNQRIEHRQGTPIIKL